MRRLALRACALPFVIVAACGARSSLLEPMPDSATDAGATCIPQAEQCNGLDDDCNGLIDDGLSFGSLGPAVELRDLLGDTGDCTSCSWAWDPVLAPQAGGGWLAIWWLGIYGGREMPNLWGRALDADGTPREAPRLLARDIVMDQQAVAASPLPGGDTLLGVSMRRGTSDLPGLLRVSPEGMLTFTTPRSPIRCHTPTSMVAGRVLCVNYDGGALTTATMAPDGSDVTTQSIPLPGVGTAVAGTYGERAAALAYTVAGGARTLYWLALSPRGELRGSPRALSITYESYPRLVGTSEGWLVIMPGQSGAPARFARLDTEGNLVAGLQPWPDNHPLDDSSLESVIVHHPSARQLVVFRQDLTSPRTAAMAVEMLDERGAVTASWTGASPGSGVVASPAVQFSRDGLFVSWHDIARDSTPNRVYAQRFGCTP